jgi:hypothetical protein
MKPILIICSLLIATAGLTTPQLPSDKPWVVEGKVVDDSGPVPDVSIHVFGGGTELGAVTDENGHFRATGTDPGKYTIRPGKDGYEGGEDGDPKNAISLTLAARTYITGANFVVHQAASISGRILDSNRKPIKGAVVVLWVKHFNGYRGFLQTRTAVESDASGRYLLKDIGAETYFLSAARALRDNVIGLSGPPEAGSSPPKLKPVRTYYPSATSLDNAAPIYLNRAEQREGVDLTMVEELTFCVTGKYIPAFGEVPLWSRLTVAQTVGSTWAGWVGSGDVRPGEWFRACDLPPGSYAAAVLAIGKDKLARLVSQAFTVANRDVAVGDLSVGPPDRLQGKVIVPDAPADSPLPEVRLEVSALNRPAPFAGEGSSGRTNKNGQFSIENIFTDDYSLQVTRLPRGFYVKSINQSGRDVTNEPIRPGADLTITLSSDGPVVNGQAVDSDNQPVAQAHVMLIPRDPSSGSIVSTLSDSSGKFQMQSGIAPGEYSIVALSGIYEGEEENPEFARDQMNRATRLDLDPRESESVTLTVRAAHPP